MKIRQGFVSNSSSTSFCILGAAMDFDVYKTIEQDENKKLYDVLKDIGLKIEGRNDYDSSMYIGLNPSDMKDDETLKQFKEKIDKGIKKFCDEYKIEINSTISWETDGWYEG